MSESTRLQAARRSVMDKIDEALRSNDADLWEELDAKVADVMVVWRRAQAQRIYTDEEVSQMAFRQAVEDFRVEMREPLPATDREWEKYLDVEFPRDATQPR